MDGTRDGAADRSRCPFNRDRWCTPRCPVALVQERRARAGGVETRWCCAVASVGAHFDADGYRAQALREGAER